MVMVEEAVDATSKRSRKRKEAEVQTESNGTSNGSGRTMSDAHKAALAQGREHGRIVRNYLDALHAHKPRRGRRRTTESIEARLAQIEQDFDGANALDRLHMAQEKLDLEAELAAQDDDFDITDLEADFIAVALSYSEAKGLTRTAWRQAGVAPSVLTAAGITR